MDTGHSFVRATMQPATLELAVSVLGGESSGTAWLTVRGIRQYGSSAGNGFVSLSAPLNPTALAAQNGPLPPASDGVVIDAHGEVPMLLEEPVPLPFSGQVTGGRDDSLAAGLLLAAGVGLAVAFRRRRRVRQP